mgnify:CR=1 FL=1|tara:strand:- start:99 stop:359 length:261 start_codon:yes stop_codon:yes gene_type:complete
MDAKASGKIRTVVRARPTVIGSSPNLNENHMDKEMMIGTWDPNVVIEDMDSYPDLEEHMNILKDCFYKKYPLAVDAIKAAGNNAFR